MKCPVPSLTNDTAVMGDTESTSSVPHLFQLCGGSMHSHQCPLGRRHCQCPFPQEFPAEGLAPPLMTGDLKPGYLNASAPAFH